MSEQDGVLDGSGHETYDCSSPLPAPTLVTWSAAILHRLCVWRTIFHAAVEAALHRVADGWQDAVVVILLDVGGQFVRMSGRTRD